MNYSLSGPEGSSNSKLADKIEGGEYDSTKNGQEVYEAQNGMRISINDQEGANTMVGWLREADKNEAQFQHQNEVQINKLANEGMTSTSVSPEMTNALRQQDLLAEKAKADARHQEAIDSNKKAYEGMTSTSVSPEMTNALRQQDLLAEKAKADARHQEAIDSNKKANEVPVGNFTQTGRNALRSQDTIAELAKENARLQETATPVKPSTPEIDTTTTVRDLHQEALDRNTKANEGFTGTLTQTGRNALRSQDTIAELAKENARLQEKKELTPEQQELQDIKVLIKEQSVQIQQLILIMQQNITNIHNNTVINGGGTSATVPTEEGTITPEVPLTPEQKEIIDIKATVSQQSEQINQLIAIMQQTNNININNVNGTPNTTETTNIGDDGPIIHPAEATATTNIGDDGPIIHPTEATATTATTEQTPVVQETTPTPEARRKLKVAYIAGAVIGGSTGILGGAHVAGIGALSCIAGEVLNGALRKISISSVERWERRLKTVTDPDERAKLEKRKERWTKVKTFTETTASDFLRGAKHGFLASSIFSGVFLGGHGLAWNTPEPIMPTSPNPAGPSQGPIGNGGGAEAGGGNIGGGTETQPFDSGLLQNGRVNLPGDPSNGNLATGPIGNLQGGAENFNNYAGGQSDMGWFRLNEYLNNAHIKAADLAAAGGDLHRMGYALQVNPTRTLPDLLNQFGGSNLLQ